MAGAILAKTLPCATGEAVTRQVAMPMVAKAEVVGVVVPPEPATSATKKAIWRETVLTAEMTVEEVAEATATSVISQVTWLENALTKINDHNADQWSATNAARKVTWQENARVPAMAMTEDEVVVEVALARASSATKRVTWRVTAQMVGTVAMPTSVSGERQTTVATLAVATTTTAGAVRTTITLEATMEAAGAARQVQPRGIIGTTTEQLDPRVAGERRVPD